MSTAGINNTFKRGASHFNISRKRPRTTTQHWARIRWNVSNRWVIRIRVAVVRRPRTRFCTKDFNTAIIKWKNSVLFCFFPPQTNHLLQAFWFFRRQVMHFREVFSQVVQTPCVVFIWHVLVMERDCFVSLRPNSTMPHHFEILWPALISLHRTAKCVTQAFTVHCHLFMPV